MTNAGYSGTPLAKKLGLKEGYSVALWNAPKDLRKLLGEVPPGVRFAAATGRGHDVIHFFTRSRKELEKDLPKLRGKIKQDGMIWVSWPKKASKVPTDITEDTVRDTALALDLVDVKVCAVDAVWSGLKLVIPVAKRKK
jgi:hypothetical protein